jgi:hypothetical protein
LKDEDLEKSKMASEDVSSKHRKRKAEREVVEEQKKDAKGPVKRLVEEDDNDLHSRMSSNETDNDDQHYEAWLRSFFGRSTIYGSGNSITINLASLQRVHLFRLRNQLIEQALDFNYDKGGNHTAELGS